MTSYDRDEEDEESPTASPRPPPMSGATPRPSGERSPLLSPFPGGPSSPGPEPRPTWDKVYKRFCNPHQKKERNLVIMLILLILFGTANRILFRKMLYPMGQYAYFCGQINTIMFIPLFFGLSWYFMKQEKPRVAAKMRAFPKWKMAVMGSCDMIAGNLGIFASVHLPGPIVVLLGQATTPFTMFFSYIITGARYRVNQYMGAGVVVCGMLVAIAPQFMHSSGDTLDENTKTTLFWAGVCLMSAVPAALSSVFQEVVMGQMQINEFYLNFHTTLFQFLLGLPMMIPAAPAQGVAISGILDNFRDGARCWLWGMDSPGSTGHCASAPVVVNSYMIVNLAYNILLMLVLKNGSAAIVVISGSVVIPIANLMFTMPSIMGDEASTLSTYDLIALGAILSGMIIYRINWVRERTRPEMHINRNSLDSAVIFTRPQDRLKSYYAARVRGQKGLSGLSRHASPARLFGNGVRDTSSTTATNGASRALLTSSSSPKRPPPTTSASADDIAANTLQLDSPRVDTTLAVIPTYGATATTETGTTPLLMSSNAQVPNVAPVTNVLNINITNNNYNS